MIDSAMLSRLMVQTGFAPAELSPPVPTRAMLKLARAIWSAAAADEREACAALLDENAARCGDESMMRLILETNAAAIRARSKPDA